MRQISNRFRHGRRQQWIKLPPSGLRGTGSDGRIVSDSGSHQAAQEAREGERANAKNAALGIERLNIEIAGVFKPDLKRVMVAHGIDNQQEVYQLLMNLITADFETQAMMLRCVTTPFVVSEKVSRIIREAGMKSIADDPPEPEDEVDAPMN